MGEKWSPIEIRNLISYVKERPELYDSTSFGYSNLNNTDTLWSQISEKFENRTEHELRKKWQILRTGYRTRRGEKYSLFEPGNKPMKKWAYFDSLIFLEPFMADRNSTTNVIPSANETPQSSCSCSTSFSSHDGANSYSYDDNSLDDQFKVNLVRKQEAPSSYKKSSNELFLASLLEDMNKLSPTDLLKFKIVILNKLGELLNS